jgi:hypothetical protein
MATAVVPQQQPQQPDPVPVEGKTIKALTLLHLKRTRELFAPNYGQPIPPDEDA